MRTGTWISLFLMACAVEPNPRGLRSDGASQNRVSTTAATTINGATGARLGWCVAPAGDVNGDGYDDVLISTGASSTVNTVGLYRGSSSGLSTSPTTTWSITEGCPILADVTGDGYDDLVVSRRTVIDVYNGSSTGWSSTRSSQVTGLPSADYRWLRSAGDVDGDGDDEIYTFSNVLYFGSSTGLSSTSKRDFGAIYGDGTVGDFNGDGYGDVGVVMAQGGPSCWAPYKGYSGTTVVIPGGAIDIYYGSSTGLPSSAVREVSGTCKVVDARITSLEVQADGFTGRLANPGDVNGDGKDDLLVVRADRNKTSTSETYNSRELQVYASTSTGFSSVGSKAARGTAGAPIGTLRARSLGDTNADGYGDFVTQGVTLGLCDVYDGTSSGVGAGYLPYVSPTSGTWGDCAGAGDVNGDGADDYIIGELDAPTTAGVVKVFHGVTSSGTDDDGDGYDDTIDCDDDDASIHPGATEVIGDEIDSDCDGEEFCFEDLDGDGARGTSWSTSTDEDCADPGELSDSADKDCDDSDGSIYPGATEIVGDEVDSDCDGAELCYADADGDGARSLATVVSSDTDCDGAGEATDLAAVDCDDGDAARFPGATEVVGDEVDQDCDATEICFVNGDGDGYRTASTIASPDLACDGIGEAKVSVPPGDCNDGDVTIYPGATEVVGDDIDQDCDGAEVCYVDGDADGYRTAKTVPSVDVLCGGLGEARASDPAGDCDDTDRGVYPGATEAVGDEVDQDCDGTEVCFVNDDGDGYRIATTVASADVACDGLGEASLSVPPGDCDDADPDSYPGAAELVGDEVDQDCDGTEVCFLDGDDDGYRPDLTSTVVSTDTDCADSTEALATDPFGDCDDSRDFVSPAGTEVVGDEEDWDCDGMELCFEDGDGDGWRTTTSTLSSDVDCTDSGEAATSVPSLDCDDTDPRTNPAAYDVIGDGIDQDCDGKDAESVTAGCSSSATPGTPLTLLLGLALFWAPRRRQKTGA